MLYYMILFYQKIYFSSNKILYRHIIMCYRWVIKCGIIYKSSLSKYNV